MLDKSQILQFFQQWQRNLDTFGNQAVNWRSLRVWNEEQKKWEKLKDPTWNKILAHCFNLELSAESKQKVFGQPISQFKQSIKSYRRGSWLKRWWLRLTQDMEKKDIAWRYYKNLHAFNEDQKMLTVEEQLLLQAQPKEPVQPKSAATPTFAKVANRPAQTHFFSDKSNGTAKTYDELKAAAIAHAEYQMSAWAIRIYPKVLEALKKLYQDPKNSKDYCAEKEQRSAVKRQKIFAKRLSTWSEKLFKGAHKDLKDIFETHCKKRFTEIEKELNSTLEEKLAAEPDITKGNSLRQRLYSRLHLEQSSAAPASGLQPPTLDLIIREHEEPSVGKANDKRSASQDLISNSLNFNKLPEPLTPPELNLDLTEDEVKGKLDAFYEAALDNIKHHKQNILQLLNNWQLLFEVSSEMQQEKLKELLLPLRSSYRQTVFALHADTHAKRKPSPDLTTYLNQKFNEFKEFYDETINELEECVLDPNALEQEDNAETLSNLMKEIFKEDIARIEKILEEMREQDRVNANLIVQLKKVDEELDRDLKKIVEGAENLQTSAFELSIQVKELGEKQQFGISQLEKKQNETIEELENKVTIFDKKQHDEIEEFSQNAKKRMEEQQRIVSEQKAALEKTQKDCENLLSRLERFDTSRMNTNTNGMKNTAESPQTPTGEQEQTNQEAELGNKECTEKQQSEEKHERRGVGFWQHEESDTKLTDVPNNEELDRLLQELNDKFSQNK